jgi:hypothetical protein
VTLPDVHLAGEAVAAYVDDALSPTARDRAERHLRACAECRAVVGAQREAKVLLAAAFDPELPAGLLARLRDIPMTADLGGSDIVLAVHGEQFSWARRPAWPDSAGDVRFATDPAVAVASVPAMAAVPVAAGVSPAGVPAGGRQRFGAAFGWVSADGAGSRPYRLGRRDTAERGGRPKSYPAGDRSSRPRRNRRLAGALAGLAFGVIASAASGAGGTAVPDPRVGGPSGGSTQLVVNRAPLPGAPLDARILRVGVPVQRQAGLLGVTDAGR